MKKLLVIALSVCPCFAIASWNEVECSKQSSTQKIGVEIEQSFPTGSVFQRMLLSVTKAGTQKDFNYTVTSRRSNASNRILYNGGGARLEVDLWPDQAPSFGRSYRGSLVSSDLSPQSITGLDCRFPNAF